MSRYQFEIATSRDDAELRRILSETVMPGRVCVSFRREPSYFAAAVVEGGFCQTVIARDRREQRIAGLGCRSVRDRFVNGQPTPIGYLSTLRMRPQYQRTGLLAHAYRYLRSLHDDGRTRLYLTTIAEGNRTALSVLTSGRAGLPRYHFAGDYHTLAVPLVAGRKYRRGAQTGLEIRPASASDLPELVRFLGTVGADRQFFPKYEARDFFHAQATFRDLQPADLLLAFRQRQLVGTLAAWEQSGFRQTMVEAYTGALQWMRPIYDWWAGIRGLPKLARPGHPFRFLTGALPIARDNDPSVLTALLQELIERRAAGPCAYLLIGMHADDPLRPVVTAYNPHTYRTHLYYVCWEEGEALRAELDNRPPYLELGCL